MDSSGKDSEIIVEVLEKNSEKVIAISGLKQGIEEEKFQAVEALSKEVNASVKMKPQDNVLEIIF